MRACCQLLFRAEPQVVFEGDVKGGPVLISGLLALALSPLPHTFPGKTGWDIAAKPSLAA